LVKMQSDKVRAIRYGWLFLIFFADYIGDFRNKQSITLYIKNTSTSKTRHIVVVYVMVY